MWHYSRIKLKGKENWSDEEVVSFCACMCALLLKQKWNAPLWFLSRVSEKERLCNRKWGRSWQKHTGSGLRPASLRSESSVTHLTCRHVAWQWLTLMLISQCQIRLFSNHFPPCCCVSESFCRSGFYLIKSCYWLAVWHCEDMIVLCSLSRDFKY